MLAVQLPTLCSFGKIDTNLMVLDFVRITNHVPPMKRNSLFIKHGSFELPQKNA